MKIKCKYLINLPLVQNNYLIIKAEAESILGKILIECWLLESHFMDKFCLIIDSALDQLIWI